MTTLFDELLIGYDYDAWYGYAEKMAISVDVSTKVNSHTLVCGMSGSGKSYLTNQYLARICLHGGEDSVVYFADYKQDDSFAYLRECPRYYPYNKTIDALEEVYEIMHKRQRGEDTTRNYITLIWDEYVANILSFLGSGKKKAEAVMHKVSEILMLGRSLAVRLHEWVAKGRSPYDNGDYICGAGGYPLDFISALRAEKELQDWFDSLSEAEKEAERQGRSYQYATETDEIYFDISTFQMTDAEDDDLPFQ